MSEVDTGTQLLRLLLMLGFQTDSPPLPVVSIQTGKKKKKITKKEVTVA